MHCLCLPVFTHSGAANPSAMPTRQRNISIADTLLKTMYRIAADGVKAFGNLFMADPYSGGGKNIAHPSGFTDKARPIQPNQ